MFSVTENVGALVVDSWVADVGVCWQASVPRLCAGLAHGSLHGGFRLSCRHDCVFGWLAQMPLLQKMCVMSIMNSRICV